jgi:hypothetical protein
MFKTMIPFPYLASFKQPRSGSGLHLDQVSSGRVMMMMMMMMTVNNNNNTRDCVGIGRVELERNFSC